MVLISLSSSSTSNVVDQTSSTFRKVQVFMFKLVISLLSMPIVVQISVLFNILASVSKELDATKIIMPRNTTSC